WPENSLVLEAVATPYDGTLLFRIDLTDTDVERIEAQREGRDITFNLLVMCEISGAGTRAWSSQDNIQYTVSRATWIDILGAFGLTKRLLIEVDLPAEGAVESAVARLHRARAEHNAGNYDGVVRECRIALESIKKALKLENEIGRAFQEYNGGERRKMTK